VPPLDDYGIATANEKNIAKEDINGIKVIFSF
jgi:hypothetical protein